MKVIVVNLTRYVGGAHATTMLINDYVNAHLADYGPAVESVEVTVVYPPKSHPGRWSSGGFADFAATVRRSPRVTFYRAKRRIEVRCVCRGVSVRRIEADGHLNADETASVAETVSAALELIRPKLRPGASFDYERFLRDAQAALLRCPRELERVLGAHPAAASASGT